MKVNALQNAAWMFPGYHSDRIGKPLTLTEIIPKQPLLPSLLPSPYLENRKSILLEFIAYRKNTIMYINYLVQWQYPSTIKLQFVFVLH